MQAYICLVWWSLEVGVLSALVSANMWKMQVAETIPGPQRLSSCRDYPKLSEALIQVSKCWPCCALHGPSHSAPGWFYLLTDTINAKQITCIIMCICTVPSIAAEVTCSLSLSQFFHQWKLVFLFVICSAAFVKCSAVPGVLLTLALLPQHVSDGVGKVSGCIHPSHHMACCY